jgi:hypothetical protein
MYKELRLLLMRSMPRLADAFFTVVRPTQVSKVGSVTYQVTFNPADHSVLTASKTFRATVVEMLYESPVTSYNYSGDTLTINFSPNSVVYPTSGRLTIIHSNGDAVDVTSSCPSSKVPEGVLTETSLTIKTRWLDPSKVPVKIKFSGAGLDDLSPWQAPVEPTGTYTLTLPPVYSNLTLSGLKIATSARIYTSPSPRQFEQDVLTDISALSKPALYIIPGLTTGQRDPNTVTESLVEHTQMFNRQTISHQIMLVAAFPNNDDFRTEDNLEYAKLVLFPALLKTLYGFQSKTGFSEVVANGGWVFRNSPEIFVTTKALMVATYVFECYSEITSEDSSRSRGNTIYETAPIECLNFEYYNETPVTVSDANYSVEQP